MIHYLGYYTFYNSNGQSTVDYMLASQSIFYDAHYFIVNSHVEFSDHRLISVYIKSQVQREITPEIKKIPVASVGQYKWDQDSVDFYKDALLEKESVEGILHLNSILDDNKFNDIDLLVSNASNIYLKAASKILFYKKKHVPGRKVKKARPKKTWMSSNCLLLRMKVRSLGKKL